MKRSIFHLVVVAATSCFLTSCFTTKQSTYTYTETKSVPVSKLSDYTTEYVGKPHNYIVTSLGAPDRQTSDGAGGTILIYEETTVTATSSGGAKAVAYDVDYTNKTYTPGAVAAGKSVQTTQTDYIHLFVNEEGVCYNVKTNHQKIIQKQEEKVGVKEDEKLTLFGKICLGIFCPPLLLVLPFL